MPDSELTVASLVAELKQRRVFRTALIYVAVAWLIIQAVDIVGPALFLPGWSTTLVIVLLVLGMPFAVLLAWRFDLVGGEAQRQASPEGKAATFIWLAFSIVTLIGGSWLAYYSYTQTMLVTPEVHASFGEYAPPDHSVAVLPFVNLSGNPDNEHFGDGLADTVLHRLAQVDQLFVIARTSSFRFKGSDEGIESIGRKLNVGAVLEGSVQQIGNQMRIIAQLIDARTGEHLSSLTFDADTEDLFSVQDEISLQVAEALEIELLSSVTERLTASGTDDPKAHELYMLGRFHASKYTPEGVRQGHRYFKQAIALDPEFVLAYVGVADTLIRSPRFEQVPFTVIQSVHDEYSRQAFPDLDDTQRYEQARNALTTAMELDDQSAEAYASRGYLETWLGDRLVAEPLFQKAIELRPGSADARYVYGRYLAEARRYAESLQQLQRAMELDPANIPILVWNTIFMRKDFDSSREALVLFNRIAELDPQNEFNEYRNPSIYSLAWMHTVAVGRHVDAVSWLEKGLMLEPDLPINVMEIGITYHFLGDPESGDRWRTLAAASPKLYEDKNGLAFEIWGLLMQDRTDEARDLTGSVFGNSGHPQGLLLMGLIECYAGRADEAVRMFDAIPEALHEGIFFGDEQAISDMPAFGVYYAHALMRSGAEKRADAVLLQVQEYVSYFRQQGYVSAILDYMDAQVFAIRDQREEALAALRMTTGRHFYWPLWQDPIFETLRDDPGFQKMMSSDAQHRAEQLEKLRERHRIPPPWSPDYFPTE